MFNNIQHSALLQLLPPLAWKDFLEWCHLLNTTALVTSTLACWEDFLKSCQPQTAQDFNTLNTTVVKTWNKCLSVQMKHQSLLLKEVISKSLGRIITIRVVFLGWTTRLIWASECWRPCVYIAVTHVLCPYLSNLTKLTNQIEIEILPQIEIQIQMKKILFQRPSWCHFESPQTLLKLPNRPTIELCKTNNKINSNKTPCTLHYSQPQEPPSNPFESCLYNALNPIVQRLLQSKLEWLNINSSWLPIISYVLDGDRFSWTESAKLFGNIRQLKQTVRNEWEYKHHCRGPLGFHF